MDVLVTVAEVTEVEVKERVFVAEVVVEIVCTFQEVDVAVVVVVVDDVETVRMIAVPVVVVLDTEVVVEYEVTE